MGVDDGKSDGAALGTELGDAEGLREGDPVGASGAGLFRRFGGEG